MEISDFNILKWIDRIIKRKLNPSEHKCKLMRLEQYDTMLVVLINDPKHKCYNGDRIFVFENIIESEFRRIFPIIPHICHNTYPSPIAEFEATSYGWNLACMFVERCNNA